MSSESIKSTNSHGSYNHGMFSNDICFFFTYFI
jgi:hypothetical protein